MEHDELYHMYIKSDLHHELNRHTQILSENIAKVQKELIGLKYQLAKRRGIPYKVAIPLGLGIAYVAYREGRERGQRKTASDKERVEKLKALLDKTVKEKNAYAALADAVINKHNKAIARWAFLAGLGTTAGLALGALGGYHWAKREEGMNNGQTQLAQFSGI